MIADILRNAATLCSRKDLDGGEVAEAANRAGVDVLDVLLAGVETGIDFLSATGETKRVLLLRAADVLEGKTSVDRMAS